MRTTIIGSAACSSGPGANRAWVTAVDGGISLIAAVEAGQGIGFAPSTFAVVAGRRVRFVPLSAAPPLAVGYVVRATRLSEILETFIHALHSVTRKA